MLQTSKKLIIMGSFTLSCSADVKIADVQKLQEQGFQLHNAVEFTGSCDKCGGLYAWDDGGTYVCMGCFKSQPSLVNNPYGVKGRKIITKNDNV